MTIHSESIVRPWAGIAAGLALSCATACVDAPDDTASVESELSRAPCHDPNPALFAPDAHPYGHSMVSWAESWWRWGLGIPLALNPNDTVGASPDIHQEGPVYFLPNPPAGGAATCGGSADTYGCSTSRPPYQSIDRLPIVR